MNSGIDTKVKLKLFMFHVHAMKAYGWSQGKDSYTLTFPPTGDKWSDSCFNCFTTGKRVPGTHWIEGRRILKTVWTWW
jgi:hypothetical protein